jgi:hypothetical protein
MLPTDWRLTAIREHRLTARFRDKVLVYDERDRPWCGFPGVYVSMPDRSFDERFQRAWGYYRVPAWAGSDVEPDLLFSFVGSPSSRCRKELTRLRHPDAIVELVHGFTFYSESSPSFDDRRARFRAALGRSRFVLCPRGRGTSSIRLYETLAAGRVPVVISDAWVAPEGPDWDAFSIRWPEGRTKGLVELLEARSAEWRRMSSAASAAYHEFFAPQVSFHGIVGRCAELEESDALGRFPRSGMRGRAFFEAGADVVRWRTTTSVRRSGGHLLRRLRRAVGAAA